MSVRRLLSNISSDRLQESRDFYADLLGMEVAFESDWYIRLHSPTNPGLELGIIQRDHPLLPAVWRAGSPSCWWGCSCTGSRSRCRYAGRWASRPGTC